MTNDMTDDETTDGTATDGTAISDTATNGVAADSAAPDEAAATSTATDDTMTDDAMTDDAADQQQRSIAQALRHARLSANDLWVRYFALGGEAGLIDVDAYVHGLGGLPPLQRDILAHAVNERLDELTPPHRADYSRQVRETRPRGRPLTALVELLEGAKLAPPERLPALIDAAADALGVRVAVYLIDYDERRLHPWPAQRGDREPLDVDTTLAGRAYRHVRTLTARGAGRPRLWLPLLDGVERLGVLGIEVATAADLDDPGLRTQCKWLSMLVGHLVTLLTQYGDAVDLVRIPVPRTVTGELMWSLLPPTTAGVDSFVVTGLVEPRHRLSGDAFDYALSETTASLVILDAPGRDLRGGLVAATALAAHRSARHAGHGLYEQARVIDEAIGEQFGGSASATAVLVEVDLATGRMRYINAGHPRPLVMRGGGVVKALAGGLTPPLGTGLGELAVAEEVLEPEDWLVLHTDGITGARDSRGEVFGEARLVDFLHREAAAGHPPPETARRLIRAVIAHQKGGGRADADPDDGFAGSGLQDDAAVVLARWTHPSTLTP